MEGEVGQDISVKKSGPPQPQVTRRGLFQIIVHSGVKGQEKPPPVRTLTNPKPDELTRRELFGLTAGSGAASLIASSLIFGVKPWELLDVLSALGKTPDKTLPPPQPTPTPKKEQPPPKPEAFNLVFGDLPPLQKEGARKEVEAMRNLLKNHSSYNGMLTVTTRWEQTIRENARRVGFPEELALGIIFIENGGGEDLISGAKARGVAQLMPETARRYGLRVDAQVDERANPAKSITAMCNYLKDNLDRFGNFGIATWAYHAGEGNVYEAVREYFKDTIGEDAGDIVSDSHEEALGVRNKYRQYLEKVNVHQVLSNPRVQKNVLSRLEDETELYAYKAVAAAELLKKGL